MSTGDMYEGLTEAYILAHNAVPDQTYVAWNFTGRKGDQPVERLDRLFFSRGEAAIKEAAEKAVVGESSLKESHTRAQGAHEILTRVLEGGGGQGERILSLSEEFLEKTAASSEEWHPLAERLGSIAAQMTALREELLAVGEDISKAHNTSCEAATVGHKLRETIDEYRHNLQEE